jgi:hypothetical protein
MAEEFALPFQLLASVVVMNGARALTGDAGAIVVIILGNLVIQLRPVSVEAGPDALPGSLRSAEQTNSAQAGRAVCAKPVGKLFNHLISQG